MTAEILVTGAAGFIGSHLAVECAARGWRVTGVDRRMAPGPVRERTEFLLRDAADQGVLDEIRNRRYAAVLHQAAISSTTEQSWASLERHNVTNALRLAEACAAGGAGFIYASSHSVYGRITRREPVPEDAVDDPGICSGPLNLYARSKLLLDREMARRFPDGLRWLGLRYTNVFGTGEEHKGPMASIISQLLRDAAARRPVRLFSDTLDACRDYVPVRTVVSCCADLVEAPAGPGLYNLGSGHPVSFRTLLRWCGEFSAGRALDVRLIANPLSARYQFWTCADVSKLRTALPDLPIPGEDEIRSAALELFTSFAGSAARPRQPESR